MLTIEYKTKFKKDFKKMVKRNYDIGLFEEVLKLLVNGRSLPEIYKDPAVSGNYSGYRECHILPDWLLIYMIDDDELVLVLMRTGSHSDLF